MNIQKGKTSNGYANVYTLQNNAIALTGWRYFTFTVNAIKNTIANNIILDMYFFTATTSVPD